MGTWYLIPEPYQMLGVFTSWCFHHRAVLTICWSYPVAGDFRLTKKVDQQVCETIPTVFPPVFSDIQTGTIDFQKCHHQKSEFMGSLNDAWHPCHRRWVLWELGGSSWATLAALSVGIHWACPTPASSPQLASQVVWHHHSLMHRGRW